MKKSKPSQKKIEIMCINNDCSAFLSPTELPSKLSLGEIYNMGYDSIKLDDDWIVFDAKNIKVINVEKLK